MKQNYCVFIFLLLLSLRAIAQIPSITNVYPETACLGAVHKIQMSVNGEFAKDNQFTVQVRQNETSPIAYTIPGMLKDGKLEVVHKDSTLSLYQNVQLRIVSSSPKVESAWVIFTINSKGFIQLTLADSDTINAGDDLTIKFTTFSSSSVQVLLNNGSEFSISSYAEGTFETYHQIGADKSDPFYIVQANNICGAMKTSGQAIAVINPVSLRTTSVYPSSTCEDGEIRVGFSVLGTALPAQTKYRLRFTVYDSDLGSFKIAEAPAELKGNALVARFPQTLKITSRSVYKIKILADNPAVSGAYTDYDFYVYPKATALFNTPGKSINVGEKATIGVSFTGLSPFSAELQDGTTISTSYSRDYMADVRPDKTTTYTIKSFTSGCGQITPPATQKMVVTVNPGIFLETDGGPEIFCAGSVVKVKMAANVDLNAATFTVNAIFANETAYSFPAKRSGDSLEFTIPSLPANTDPLLSYDGIIAWNITTLNPALKSNNSDKYVVQSMPGMTLLEHSKLNYNTPSQASFGYALNGKGPYKIEDADKIIYDTEGYEIWYPSIYVNRTKDFKLRSISNSCFKNETLPTVRLTLDVSDTPPGLYMEPLKPTICRQDSLEITFAKTGSFTNENVFKIEGYIDCCTFLTLATVNTEGKYKVKIPASQFHSAYVTFRISSTSPEVFSESFQVKIESLPANFKIKPVGTALLPIETWQDTEVDLSISSDGAGIISSFIYSDGISDKTKNLKSYENSVKVLPPVGTTTAYTIKSATNECGTVPVNLTTYIRTIPYRIIINAAENARTSNFCPEGSLVIPFVTIGRKEIDPTFSLQVAKEKSTEFITLVRDQSSHQFITTVPATLEPGNYQLRVISSDGAFSNIINIQIGAIPGATITSDQPQPITL
ncbi:hypothetical protein [Dyadobacter sp. NIV53]|uniref:hypothetical protein n=1 Tax=Dyadobacter sp. NIV53 TaxID=2861765 RepID=UPI001C88688A|nr:hypothetical protein [Dyadobacter sp. NIV53]